MDADAIAEAVENLGERILAANREQLGELVIAGIPTRGVELSKRVAAWVSQRSGQDVELGVVDVSMHRDDLATRPELRPIQTTHLPLDLDGRPVVLVDDVLFTGRSCRAAMETLLSYGRPRRVQLAVLVDRGHRELPIQPDFVGQHVDTDYDEKIRVRFENLDGTADSVRVVKPK